MMENQSGLAERLVEQYKETGDIVYRNRLVEISLNYINGEAKKLGKLYDKPDMRQNAVLGFIEAVENHDSEKGHIYAYASHWIHKYIMDHTNQKVQVYMNSATQRVHLKRLERLEFTSINDDKPEYVVLQEMAKEESFRIETFYAVHSAMFPVSLGPEDWIPDHEVEEESDMIEKKDDLLAILEKLHPDDTFLLTARYGFVDEPARFDKIANELGFDVKEAYSRHRTLLGRLRRQLS